MRPRPLLDIRRLTRDYASAGLLGRRTVTRAVDDVSLAVLPGEIFGIVGESGCGKSTLARIVMALDRPTSGDVLFDGEELFLLAPDDLRHRRADFQMVFQDPFGSLDPRHTVGRIVAEPLYLRSRCDARQRRDRVAEMLESVGLAADAAERYPHQFSGGQRQRIAIARALVTEPKLVVADEAVSALDLSVQAQVLNLLLDLRARRGVTFLFVSHNLGVVDCIADRVGVMYLGRLVELGPAHALFDAPLHPYTRLLVEAEPSIHRLGAPPLAPARPPSAAAAGGCAFAPRCPAATDRCRAVRPDLIRLGDGRAVACHHPLGPAAAAPTPETMSP
jgi:peptide/nickel transport system ATP-binding protein